MSLLAQARAFSQQASDPAHSPDFRGYHCSHDSDPQGGAPIPARYEVGGEWIEWIMDELPEQDLDKFEQASGLNPEEPDPDDDWAHAAARFLGEEGYRWTFVSDAPISSSMYSDYGSHCFYVMLPKEKCIQIPDPYEVDSSVLVYKTEDAPEMIPLEDDG